MFVVSAHRYEIKNKEKTYSVVLVWLGLLDEMPTMIAVTFATAAHVGVIIVDVVGVVAKSYCGRQAAVVAVAFVAVVGTDEERKVIEEGRKKGKEREQAKCQQEQEKGKRAWGIVAAVVVGVVTAFVCCLLSAHYCCCQVSFAACVAFVRGISCCCA